MSNYHEEDLVNSVSDDDWSRIVENLGIKKYPNVYFSSTPARNPSSILADIKAGKKPLFISLEHTQADIDELKAKIINAIGETKPIPGIGRYYGEGGGGFWDALKTHEGGYLSEYFNRNIMLRSMIHYQTPITLLLEHHPELPPFVADSYIGAIKVPFKVKFDNLPVGFNNIGRGLKTPIQYTDWLDRPEWPKNEYRIGGLRFVNTCCTVPEQYDVFLGKVQVGYIRQRGYYLTVEYGKCDLFSPLIYSKYFPKSYGNIPVNKRMRILRQIARTLRRVHVKKYKVLLEESGDVS